LGSFWSSAIAKDDADSDEGAYQPKPRARSEGARCRELVASAGALKKPNSRRNSRGAPLLRVSFVDSDDDEIQGKAKASTQGPSEKIFTKTLEEQEPMGEPEPACPDDSSTSPCSDTIQVKLATTANYPHMGSSLSHGQTGSCWPVGGSAGESCSCDEHVCGAAVDGSQQDSSGTRQELRVLLASGSDSVKEGEASQQIVWGIYRVCHNTG